MSREKPSVIQIEWSRVLCDAFGKLAGVGPSRNLQVMLRLFFNYPKEKRKSLKSYKTEIF